MSYNSRTSAPRAGVFRSRTTRNPLSQPPSTSPLEGALPRRGITAEQLEEGIPELFSNSWLPFVLWQREGTTPLVPAKDPSSETKKKHKPKAASSIVDAFSNALSWRYVPNVLYAALSHTLWHLEQSTLPSARWGNNDQIKYICSDPVVK